MKREKEKQKDDFYSCQGNHIASCEVGKRFHRHVKGAMYTTEQRRLPDSFLNSKCF